MDKITHQVGYLVLNEDGAVISSSGELENDEETADCIMRIVTLTGQLDPSAFPQGEGFKKLTISYDEDLSFVVCLSNRKIYVVKKKCPYKSFSTNDDIF